MRIIFENWKTSSHTHTRHVFLLALYLFSYL